jgi:preprotein translocase subunit SecA
MNKFLKMVFGDPNAKVLKSLEADVAKVNGFESAIKVLTDDQLKAKTDAFRESIESGVDLEDLIHEAFAVVREAAIRTLDQRHYDVQIAGGFVLARGQIAEMRTGEGKTLTSTLPIYLNALGGKGVHVVTVNDYLAKRDAVWMGQIFEFLGLSIGCIQHESGYKIIPAEDGTWDIEKVEAHLEKIERADAYNQDITYGTNNEFGFDYLRDNMATKKERLVQRGLNFALIDEIDSILIDEARTPLIISAPAEQGADLYVKFAGLVKSLTENEDYNIDEKMRVATFSDAGLQRVEQKLGIDNLYAEGGLAMIHHAEQALKAHAIFKKDKDYVVADDEVKIVDEFTGRIMEGRRYSEGLHQAIEAKEGVEIKRESRTLATITFQNYFRMYDKLSGMTGTAATESEEFISIYNLEVIEVPTNKPIARLDAADKIYKTELGKFAAVIKEVQERNEKGQPVLIGTASIEKNELLDTLLTQAGISHQMLNAKNHESEASIVSEAGKRGGVTLATNMAGRGVDIKLGGHDASPEAEKEIKDLGGLHVIGTERHDSRRIDNQLRGRSGRQGDPGSTQFYVSTEDDLMRIFGSDRMKNMMEMLRVPDDQAIESKSLTKQLEKAQQRVEGHNFDSRKRILDYDDVLNKHRVAIYERRRAILLDDEFDAQKELLDMLEHEVERVVLFHTDDTVNTPDIDLTKLDELESPSEQSKDWDPKEILETFKTILPLTGEFEQKVKKEIAELSKDKEQLAHQRTEVIEAFMELVQRRLSELRVEINEDEKFNGIMRTILLRTGDNAWVQHLATMRYLRRSIGLRGYGQRDPLVEYKREAFHLYHAMQEGVERDVVYNIFKVLQQSITADKVMKMAPSILEQANILFSGAKKTMDRKGAQGAAQPNLNRAARRAAAKLIQQGQAQQKGLSDDRRAQLRKKRK